jgi:hypothetical protein
MQDRTATDKWVVVARRLMAIASAHDDVEVSIPTTARADARDAADETSEEDTESSLAGVPPGS